MLESIFGSRTKIKILRKMFQQDREIWFNDMSKITGLSLGTLHPALSELAHARILKVRKAGNSTLYSLNKSHLLFPAARNIFEVERYMPKKIAKEFSKKVKKRGIKNIILFGSLARGEFGEKSDIDILIIFSGDLKKSDEDIHKVIAGIVEKYDIVISATYLSEKKVKEMMGKLDNFIVKALNEGKVLFGDEKWLKK